MNWNFVILEFDFALQSSKRWVLFCAWLTTLPTFIAEQCFNGCALIFSKLLLVYAYPKWPQFFSIYIQGIAWSIHLFFNLSSASSLHVRKFCFKTWLIFIFQIKLKIGYILMDHHLLLFVCLFEIALHWANHEKVKTHHSWAQLSAEPKHPWI